MIIFGLIAVGIVWGVTNPFLERGVKDKKQDLVGFRGFLQTILNFKFIIPFAINQSGSLFYYYLLGHTPLSLGPVIVNCVNAAVTVLTESILKKQSIKLKKFMGLSFIFMGTYLIL